ncbi:ABC transporter substrate-binding protein [Cohnella fermenti]|nr:extracellular solute-binding protein [Cohnella fermenti]
MRTTSMSRRGTAAAASALLLAITLAACSSDKNEGSEEASPSAAANSDSGGKEVVTVAVFTEDRFLEDAAAKFEQAHPDIDIQIQETVPTDTSGNQMMIMRGPGDEGPAQEDIDKYVNSIGTALMSGKAADLISVGYLPVDRYLDKGMFADWSELAGKDSAFKTDDYYERVLRGITDGDLWYAIPVDYSIRALIGDAAAIEQAGGADDKTWTWEQFIALCAKIAGETGADGKNRQALIGIEPTDLIGYLTESVYGKLVAEAGKGYKFDEEAFRGYLEQVKQLYDSGAASTDRMGQGGPVFETSTISQPMELAMLPNRLQDGESAVLGIPGSGTDEGLEFTSDLAFALNDKSKVKDAAWEFVKFLLSADIQSSPSLQGFPVHQEAAKTRLERFAEELQSGRAKIMIKSEGGEPSPVTAITDEQIEEALALLPSVGRYNRKDDKVIGIVTEETAAYFSGSKSADAVAKAVASRVDTYLNE